MKIFKYPLEITDSQTIRMPKDAMILTIQLQDDNPCIWARIPDPKVGEINHSEFRTFITVGTGNEYDGSNTDFYIGTYQKKFLGGLFVGHVFERF